MSGSSQPRPWDAPAAESSELRGGRVCVVGGGLAGIAAAIRLADRGARVTVVESRPELGGATRSFRRGDLAVDTGQHVYLRCYDQYRGLLARLGTADKTALQERFRVPVLVPGRPVHVMTRSRRAPAPRHLLSTLLRYRPLGPAERLRAIAAAAALGRVDPDDPMEDTRSFGSWLAAHRQSPRAVRRLWDLVTTAALNVPCEHASLALAARVFQAGLLASADGGDIGWPLVSLAELHGIPAAGLLHRLGVTVLTRTPADLIRPDGTGFRITAGGRERTADAVVVAVPHRVASRLVPAEAVPGRERWSRLGSAPIVNVHLRYLGKVMNLPFAAAVESPTQWIFDRTPPGLDGEQYLVVSLSAADGVIGLRSTELIARQRAAIAELFPAAATTPVRDAFVTREPHATFRQEPGTRVFRPSTVTRLPGLALAGAWTDTGWPDTMEGAVLSGQYAADAVAAHLLTPPATLRSLPVAPSPTREARWTGVAR